MLEKKADAIELPANSDREFFLIHGYTGSPTDFNNLPQQLHTTFNAHVRVLQLKGHGTHVEDLDDVTFHDLFDPIEQALQEDLRKGKTIILGGVSLGALFALILAARYSVAGVFTVCPPYILKFPFNIPGLSIAKYWKKYWKKTRGREEKISREIAFSYDYMHINGLSLVKQSSKELKRYIKNISCPLLTIHSYSDPIGNHRSIQCINKHSTTITKEHKIIDTITHNIFFSSKNEELYRNIIHFIQTHKLFEKKSQDRVVAIVPAYNEAPRIATVLKTLLDCTIIDEIIVVDDGSSDNTAQVVAMFPRIRYIKHEYNRGKAEAMETGVNASDADILFFCDADLIDFLPKHVQAIIQPVQEKKYTMFIGLRENLMQKSVRLFAINSGERALRRVVWETLATAMKHRYRIEAGLNHHVKKYFGGFGFQEFSYRQPLKEKKYGWWEGSQLRWRMNMNVLYVYIRNIFYT